MSCSEGLTLIRPASPATFSQREKEAPPLPFTGEGRGEGRQLCTPLTYQPITRASPSFMRSPLATRSLPD